MDFGGFIDFLLVTLFSLLLPDEFYSMVASAKSIKRPAFERSFVKGDAWELALEPAADETLLGGICIYDKSEILKLFFRA